MLSQKMLRSNKSVRRYLVDSSSGGRTLVRRHRNRDHRHHHHQSRLEETTTTISIGPPPPSRTRHCIGAYRFTQKRAIVHFSTSHSNYNDDVDDHHHDNDNDARAHAHETSSTEQQQVGVGVGELNNSEIDELLAARISDAINEEKYPIGTLSLEEFLEFEEDLENLLFGMTSDKDPTILLSKRNIQHSLLLFRRLVKEYEETGNPEIFNENESNSSPMKHWLVGAYPRSTKLLDQCLRNWMRFIEQNHSQEKDLTPMAILDFVDDLRSGGTPPLQLTDQTFRIIIQASTRIGQSPIFAEQLLDRLVDESMEDPLLRPSGATLQAVLSAWAKSGHPQAPEKAEALFKAMTDLYQDRIVSEEAVVDNATYMILMQVWQNSNREEAPQRVEEILKLIKNSSYEAVEPSQGAYRLAIHSWIKLGNSQATKKAYDLFIELVRDYMKNSDDNNTNNSSKVMIDGDFFSVMISALAKQREFDKAEDVFRLLGELYKMTNQDKRFEPTTMTLLAMIIAYAKSRKTGTTEKAESILLYLDDLAKQQQQQQQQQMNDVVAAAAAKDTELPPKRGYYFDVVNALGKTYSKDRIERAEKLLSRMVHHHRSGVPNMLPDAGFFDQLIVAWSRCKDKEAPLRAEGLLRTMHMLANETSSNSIKPNEKTYLLAMTAWSRSRDPKSSVRSENLLFEMLEHYNEGDITLKPTMKHYNTLISTWARSEHPEAPMRAQQAFEAVRGFYESGDKSFQPDAYLYTSLMGAWASVGDVNAMESIFLQLFEEYTATKQKNLMPTTMSFNALLDGWHRSGLPEGYQKAKLVYDSMIEFTEEGTLDVPPDVFTYSKMIDIMSESKLPDAAEQAEAYLEAMKAAPISADKFSQTKFFSCYVSTLTAWSKRRGDLASHKVETLANELINVSKSGKIPLPTSKEHRRLLKVLARSDVPGLSSRAKTALEMGNRFKITRGLLPRT